VGIAGLGPTKIHSPFRPRPLPTLVEWQLISLSKWRTLECSGSQNLSNLSYMYFIYSFATSFQRAHLYGFDFYGPAKVARMCSFSLWRSAFSPSIWLA